MSTLTRPREIGRAKLKSKASKNAAEDTAALEIAEDKPLRASNGSSSSATLSPDASVAPAKAFASATRVDDENVATGGRSTRKGRSASKAASPLKEVQSVPSTRGSKRKSQATPATADWSIAATDAAPSVDASDFERDEAEDDKENASAPAKAKSAKRKLNELTASAPRATRGGKAVSSAMKAPVMETVPEEEQPRGQKRHQAAAWTLDTVCLRFRTSKDVVPVHSLHT